MTVLRQRVVGVSMAVVISAGGFVAIRDARSASPKPPAQSPGVAHLTKRVRILEKEVNAMERTLDALCVEGHVLAWATLESGLLRTRYVNCL
jgi:hypothetical protein